MKVILSLSIILLSSGAFCQSDRGIKVETLLIRTDFAGDYIALSSMEISYLRNRHEFGIGFLNSFSHGPITHPYESEYYYSYLFFFHHWIFCNSGPCESSWQKYQMYSLAWKYYLLSEKSVSPYIGLNIAYIAMKSREARIDSRFRRQELMEGTHKGLALLPEFGLTFDLYGSWTLDLYSQLWLRRMHYSYEVVSSPWGANEFPSYMEKKTVNHFQPQTSVGISLAYTFKLQET